MANMELIIIIIITIIIIINRLFTNSNEREKEIRGYPFLVYLPP